MKPEKILEAATGKITPFYLYDLGLLRQTLARLKEAASVNPKFVVHYAMKANDELPVLDCIRAAGLGLDTVSAGEIEHGLKAGFNPEKIVFAGVAKTDREIDLALGAGIAMFNVESIPELEAISQRASVLGKTARVALRVNPDIDAHTHHYITTGLAENKFGINLQHLDSAINLALKLPGIEFYGLHFHIGSQITVMEPFRILCERVNSIVANLRAKGITVHSVNMGGGLAIDYDDPETNPIPDFKEYFDTFDRWFDSAAVNEVHFELGRAITGQCADLITSVVFVKEGDTRTFVIADAGMTELIRPALYGARHPIVNASGATRGDALRKVDIVGPVCESSDEFGKDYLVASPRRGDILSIGCAGAYGSVMSSHYNRRSLNPSVFVD